MPHLKCVAPARPGTRTGTVTGRGRPEGERASGRNRRNLEGLHQRRPRWRTSAHDRYHPDRQPAPSPEPVVTSAATPSTGEPESAREERGEDYWRNRVTTARTEKRRAEVTAAALQNRIDGLWAVLTARDDPFQRAGIEQDRFEAIRLLETTQTEIRRLDREIQDIQEEARRANVPPGWLR